MKKLSLLMMVMLVLTLNINAKKKNEKMETTEKQQVVELLNSIENGSREPARYIHPEKYIQHNQGVADGMAGFGAVLGALDQAGGGKVEVQRVFLDGNYVFTHTKYDFFGPKAGFDIFRFEDGMIVEHWDNLQTTVDKTVSGRTQFDGPTEVRDLDKTEENKALVKNFVDDVLLGAAPQKITDYVSTEYYHQHNPGIGDGLDGLGAALQSLAEAGMPMVFEKNHIILGEGNFVLSVSEGVFMKDKVSFYDLFRIENGKIVEHWDVVEKLTPPSEAKNTNGKFNFQTIY